MNFPEAFREAPLVAILRGIRPEEVVGIAEALEKAGVLIVEVPLNSPEPFDSITRLANFFSGRLVCGAGTVLKPESVDAAMAAGGQIIVAPNTNLAVIRRAREHGLAPMPGFATPTEAFAAYEAGARYLKLFPASSYGPAHLEALSAVLPADTLVLPVGGVTADNMAAWWKSGARGFGVGSEVYRPGQTPEETYRKASAVMSCLRQTMPAA